MPTNSPYASSLAHRGRQMTQIAATITKPCQFFIGEAL